MSTISSGTTITTAIQIFGDTTGNLAISTGSANTVAMTIDNSQNVAFANAVTYNGTVVFSGGLTGNGAGLTSLNGSNVTSGTVSAARLGSGTADTTTFLRGDNSWQPVQAFSSGTVMLFRQTSAPTGWTKDTTNFNDSALRVVTGSVSSGGTQGFTTAFASQTPAGSVTVSGGSVGSYTLTSSDIPGHTHSLTLPVWGGCAGFTSWGQRSASTPTSTQTTASTGGGGGHSHSFTTPTASFSGTAINLAVKYCDVIFATKD